MEATNNDIPAAIKDLNGGQSRVGKALRKKPKVPSKDLPDTPEKTEDAAKKVYQTRSRTKNSGKNKSIKAEAPESSKKESDAASKALKKEGQEPEIDPKLVEEDKVRKKAEKTAKDFAKFVEKETESDEVNKTEETEKGETPVEKSEKKENATDLTLISNAVMKRINLLEVPKEIPVEGSNPIPNPMVEVLVTFKTTFPKLFDLLVNVQSDWNYYQLAYVCHQVNSDAIGFIPEVDTIPDRTKNQLIDFFQLTFEIYGKTEETLKMIRPMIVEAVKAGIFKEEMKKGIEEVDKETESLEKIRQLLPQLEKCFSDTSAEKETHLLAKLHQMKEETEGIGDEFSVEDSVQLQLRTQINHAANPGESEVCKKSLEVYDQMHDIRAINAASIYTCESFIKAFHNESMRRLKEHIANYYVFDKIQEKIKDPVQINGDASRHKEIQLKLQEMGRQCSIKIGVEILTNALNQINDFRGAAYEPLKPLKPILENEISSFDVDQVYEDIETTRKELNNIIIHIGALKPISERGREKIKKDTRENPAPSERLVKVDTENPERKSCAENQDFILKVLVGGCVRGLGLMPENVSFTVRHSKVERAKANMTTAFQKLENDHKRYIEQATYQREQIKTALNTEITKLKKQKEAREKQLEYSTKSKKPKTSAFSFWG